MTALLTGWTLKTEQGVLRISIAVTLVMAGVGVLFGLLSGSYMIVFDGVYEMTDATKTIVALFVANLIQASTADVPSSGRFVKNLRHRSVPVPNALFSVVRTGISWKHTVERSDKTSYEWPGHVSALRSPTISVL